MKNIILVTLIVILVTLVLVGCGGKEDTKNTRATVQKTAAVEQMAPTPSETGVLSVTVTDGAVISASNLTDPLAKLTVVDIPREAGSLNIEVFQTASLASKLKASDLGLESLTSAGPAMVIKGDGELGAEMTVSVPYKGAGLHLGMPRIALILQRRRMLEIYRNDRITIEENVVKVKTSSFGAFQVVNMEGEPTSDSIENSLDSDELKTVVEEPVVVVPAEVVASSLVGTWAAVVSQDDGWIRKIYTFTETSWSLKQIWTTNAEYVMGGAYTKSENTLEMTTSTWTRKGGGHRIHSLLLSDADWLGADSCLTETYFDFEMWEERDLSSCFTETTGNKAYTLSDTLQVDGLSLVKTDSTEPEVYSNDVKVGKYLGATNLVCPLEMIAHKIQLTDSTILTVDATGNFKLGLSEIALIDTECLSPKRVSCYYASTDCSGECKGITPSQVHPGADGYYKTAEVKDGGAWVPYLSVWDGATCRADSGNLYAYSTTPYILDLPLVNMEMRF